MNHKRRRPKNRRAGCLYCKPHKGNGMKGRREFRTLDDTRTRDSTKVQLRDVEALRVHH